jgi:senataxin
MYIKDLINCLYIVGSTKSEDLSLKSSRFIVMGVVIHILSKSYKFCSCRANSIRIGVVSPYREKVLYLDNKLTTKDEWKNILDVEVKSIDGFQGGEKDIIIISIVLTKKSMASLLIVRALM